MADNLLETNLNRLPLTRLDEAAAVIGQTLAAGYGLRLGQSAVLSTKVHAFQPHNPGHVQILMNTDAGKIFYHRQDSDAVYHLDIFHQCGEVDHQFVARYIYMAIDFYNKHAAKQAELGSRGMVNSDFFDVQTATGGGRITGSLQCGKKQSVRRVHENHVHVALSIPSTELICLFYIVAAVETAIADVGLEIRCNERISHINSTGCQADLSSYTDQTDSLLTGKQPEEQTGQVAAQNDGAVQNQGFSPAPDITHSTDFAQKGHGGQGQKLVSIKLSCDGCAHQEDKKQPATSMSLPRTFTAFSAPNLHDSVKQAIRKAQNRPGTVLGSLKRQIDQKSRKGTCTAGYPFSTDIDVAATVSAAASRLIAEGLTEQLKISSADLRFAGRYYRRGYDICLLTDSSGSMAGARLEAARYLAGEISRYGCNRLSLITFQDNRAELISPLTSSRQTIFNAFDTITPSGATPLALGLRRSLAYISEQRSREPLLVLITDGIPSRKYEEVLNPLTDALAAAAEVKQANCAFLCIGLDADNVFLKKLADTAGGVIYIFTEFEKQFMNMDHQKSFR